MNPLLIAEACNPEWVSTPLIGWSLAQAIRKLVGGHLVTQVRNREALVRAGWVEGQDFTAIDSEAVAARTHKLARILGGRQGKAWTINTALSSLSYRYFEKLLWQKFGPRIQKREFNVVHRITPTSPTVPSRLAAPCRKAGVPMVVGPLNGGLPWPKEFAAAQRQEREWLSYLRGAHRFLPGYHAMRRHAAALLIGSRQTWRQQPASIAAEKCFYIPENAVDLDRFSVRRTRTASRPLHAVFLGRLVPYKGPDMLLEAAAPLIQSGDLTLEIIGDGPLKESLHKFVTEQGLTAGVHFPGWISHADLPAHLSQADLLTFPSIREFGGAVVLEAMAFGVVPVVVDYGGPGELTSEKTGFLIPLGPREQIIADLRRLLSELVQNPQAIDQRSAPAQARIANHFAWPIKARQVVKVYEWVCNPTGPKPEFPMPIPDDEK